ncbi:hypothetical protein OOZ63_27050 [Paucibacter sp. PLA-PC-4]|uniref:hypothetical protein n=1 Tax=Paucibacter sp. PLA-PC-4 TaxID=2993655 RepID=UPI00224AEDD5|nr:hypothetical protein [Paucibacter sp. PLA-PC-4]MCX2865486.1 hypothetical protein [Paucibacter sp. PLA-PC-4]
MPLEVTAIGPALSVSNESDIASVRYDGSGLSVVVARTPLDGNRFLGLRITFQRVHGFRLLDESDLAAYWAAPGFVRGHHVLAVTSGGWSAEEDLRQGHKLRRCEWLVATGNGCLSLFASEDPKIEEGEYDPEA